MSINENIMGTVLQQVVHDKLTKIVELADTVRFCDLQGEIKKATGCLIDVSHLLYILDVRYYKGRNRRYTVSIIEEERGDAGTKIHMAVIKAAKKELTNNLYKQYQNKDN